MEALKKQLQVSSLSVSQSDAKPSTEEEDKVPILHSRSDDYNGDSIGDSIATL
jgi:hypothetical protein